METRNYLPGEVCQALCAALAKVTRIFIAPLPEDVNGVLKDIDGRLYIGINGRLDASRRAYTLCHELAHIYLQHLDDPRRIALIESDADRLAGVFAEQLAAEGPQRLVKALLYDGMHSSIDGA